VMLHPIDRYDGRALCGKLLGQTCFEVQRQRNSPVESRSYNVGVPLVRHDACTRSRLLGVDALSRML
jgi:hypothetical protein